MICRVVVDFANRSAREVAAWFVESAEGKGPLADLRKTLERGIRPEWALPLDRLRNYLAYLDAEDAYVVDDLGLPEAVALYRSLREKGYIASARCFFNELGKTEFFKREVGASTLVELSKNKYAKYLGMPDREIHALGRGRYSKEGIISVIEERVKYIVNILIRGQDSLAVVSDHGYDVLKDGYRYYFAHGPYAFSKLAFLLVAHKIQP